jgi:hypothetical protein
MNVRRTIIDRRVALSIGLCLGASRGLASAQSAADKAAADTLFNEGRKRIAAGENAEACAMFEASLAKASQLGTQLALASCYEKVGKTASAWAEFRGAASAASKAHDKRQRFAEEHAAALEARLSKIVIKLEPGYRVDGLVVKRDGAAVSMVEFGAAVPVDPGDHTVEADAPGWMPWSTKVSVAPAPGVIEVVVPALGKAPVKVDEPPLPSAAVATVPDSRRPPPRRLLAYGFGGGGAAMIGVSLILGAVASSRWSDAQAHCHERLCDPTGVDLAHGAGTMGNAATATFVVGAAAVAGGVALYLTAPSIGAEKSPADSTALHVVPSIGAAQIGLTLQGGF